MTIHLLKIAVGVADPDHLRDLQSGRIHDVGGRKVVFGYTRRKPRRVEEVTDGGSIYWIIKGAIRARQRVIDLVDEVDEEGEPFCRLHLDPELVPTVAAPRRPMQGWRYLEPADAPADLSGEGGEGDGLPPEMLKELKELGLL